MGRVFYFSNLFIGLFLVFGIFSCTEDDEDTLFEAVGDVYYFNKIVDNEKVTALAFYAYGNKAIISAVVSLPGGGTTSLDGSLENSYTVFDELDENDFAPVYPEEGTYLFDLVSKDEDN
jgi:hypothetical protein